MDAVRGHR